MEVYAQSDIDLATASFRSDAMTVSYGPDHPDKENVAPCGTSSGHQALLPENTEAKTQILTRQILSDVTHRFPADPSTAFVGTETAIQNSNSRRQQTQSLATQATAAANRLRRMR